MEWISVEDRLPDIEKCIDCWCRFVGGDNNGDEFRLPNCFYDKGTDDFWYWGDGICEKVIISWAEVTHWMPLPEPPK